MFAQTVFAALVASSALAAPIAKLAERDGPSDWATDYLEPYATYHTRYLALDCQDQHNTTFFDTCCHPLLATEDLSSRPDYCTPNASQSAMASAYAATAASTASINADATDAYAQATSSVDSVYSSVEATATASADWTTALTATTSVTQVNDYAPPTTTSKAAKATQASSGNTETGGFATYFYQNGVAGACGKVHSDTDYIIAIDANGWWADYQTNDSSQYCGKQITITNTDNGKTVTATVADVCPTCDNNNSLDLSVAAFQAIADTSQGLVPISWYFS